MAYASAADFIAAFGESEWLQLTDRDRDEITDPGVGAAALETASSIVDGYASGIYALPLNVVDSVIRQITLDLARWILSGNEASDRVTEGYKEANLRLNDIASEKLKLTATRDSDASAAGMAYSEPNAVFTRQPTYVF